MKVRGHATGRNFAIVGGIFATIECGLEKVRSKKDLTNSLLAGAATGSVLAARAGPRAMLLGGAGFAAFSAVIELVGFSFFDHD
jgi:hypothetical protein